MKSTLICFSLLAILVVAVSANAETQHYRRPTANEAQQDAPAGNSQPVVVSEANHPANEAPHVEKKPEFNPYSLPYSIGFEGPTIPFTGAATTTSILASSAVSFADWVNATFGFEVYLGFVKTADTTASTTSSVVDSVANTSTVATTYSGAQTPSALLIGGAVKYRVFQSRYFGLSTDLMFSVTPPSSVQYQSAGTHTVTTPNTTTPTNYTVSDAGLSSVNTAKDLFFQVGPRVNIEYNFPYLPNLLLGFSTGIALGLGGSVTTTTTTTTQTTVYTGGTAGTPTPNTTTTSSVHTSPGTTSNTYAIGGTGLNITGGFIPVSVVGTFRIRYAF